MCINSVAVKINANQVFRVTKLMQKILNQLAPDIINSRLRSELIRYGLFGLARNGLGYGIYILATYLGMPPKLAMSVLYILGVTVSFWGNRKFIFAHSGSLVGSGGRFLAAHCVGYLINLSILIVMVDQLGFAHQWVQGGAILLVAAYLFIASKFFVFKNPPPKPKACRRL